MDFLLHYNEYIRIIGAAVSISPAEKGNRPGRHRQAREHLPGVPLITTPKGDKDEKPNLQAG